MHYATILGLKVSNVDKRVFFLQSGNELRIIVVFVDDMMFVSDSKSMLHRIKYKLSTTFDEKVFGKLRMFIGWEITEPEDGIHVGQQRYVREILSKCGLE